jgi:CDP-glucose 4,6-dehydratase
LAEQLRVHGPEFSQGWNLGPNDEDAKPVSWIVEYLSNLWGEGARWELDSAPHPHEATYLKLDCSKAKSTLGWSPKLCLSTALEWVVEWYRGYQQEKNMRRLTQAQIARYEDMEVA